MSGSGSGAVDAAAFRRVVGQYATGVTVITIQHGDHVHGMTANSFASVSLDPPLVLFCVARTARMSQLLGPAPGFVINILSERQQDISRQFAGSRKEDIERVVSLAHGPVAPIVVGSLSALSCRTETLYEGGDHWIVVGRVIAIHEHESDASLGPLVFFRSRYCDLIEPVPVGQPKEDWSNDVIRIYHEEWSAVDPAEMQRQEPPW
jgi:3-hydroxy-9,10-secoandrosta-1,3,5(10)-triene-9,17-dione monooxygenase reductase component